MNFRAKVFGGLAVISLLTGCGEEIIETLPAEEQLAEDIKLIDSYIAGNDFDFDPGDTTNLGVRFIIFDKGTGSKINYGDIVDLYYVGRFIDGELFDTNIDTVDINNGTYDSTFTYNPRRFTHTEAGWALSASGSGYAVLKGYVNGVTTMMDRINIGGSAEIIIPSSLAFGSQGSSLSPFQNKILIFDLYPTYKR